MPSASQTTLFVRSRPNDCCPLFPIRTTLGLWGGLGRLSRVDGPPHAAAPETSPCSHCPFVHTWSTHPGPVPTTGVCELTLRPPSHGIPDLPQCPGAPIQDTADGPPPPPAPSSPGQLPLKPLMPSNICGLHPSLLGCMRKRIPLSILLHLYWSRFPSPLPCPRPLRPAPQQSSSWPISRDAQSSLQLGPFLCKPPYSPTAHARYRSSISIPHDRISSHVNSITKHILSPHCLA